MKEQDPLVNFFVDELPSVKSASDAEMKQSQKQRIGRVKKQAEVITFEEEVKKGCLGDNHTGFF